MNADRYITDEVLNSAFPRRVHYGVREIVGAVLPAVLAQHRADELREAADRICAAADAKGGDLSAYEACAAVLDS